MIFNKTTNFSYKKYGDSNKKLESIPKKYLKKEMIISSKSFRKAYYEDHDIYFSVSSGIVMIVILDKDEKHIKNSLLTG